MWVVGQPSRVAGQPTRAIGYVSPAFTSQQAQYIGLPCIFLLGVRVGLSSQAYIATFKKYSNVRHKKYVMDIHHLNTIFFYQQRINFNQREYLRSTLTLIQNRPCTKNVIAWHKNNKTKLSLHRNSNKISYVV